MSFGKIVVRRGGMFVQVDWDMYDECAAQGFSNVDILPYLFDRRTGKNISAAAFYRALKRRNET